MKKIRSCTLLVVAAACLLAAAFADVSVDCQMALAFLGLCSFACFTMLMACTFRFRG
jgi:hypothetical protein